MVVGGIFKDEREHWVPPTVFWASIYLILAAAGVPLLRHYGPPTTPRDLAALRAEIARESLPAGATPAQAAQALAAVTAHLLERINQIDAEGRRRSYVQLALGVVLSLAAGVIFSAFVGALPWTP